MAKELAPIEPPELEIEKVKANRYKDMFDSDAGWLTISNQRLLFHPTVLNIDHNPSQILLEDIQSLGYFSPLGIIPTGILISCKDGSEHKFVVNQRDKVIEIMRKQLP
jgi:hypothetical protein